jgi:aminoglycoside phosphotransferase (APT) family kinase protein
LRAELAASPVRTGPFDRGYARLAELAEGLPDKRHIIHGDLLNRNVLVQGERITAVIDWRNALYGDRLYDAAWLIFWQPWFPHWQSTTHRRTGTALEPARWPATRARTPAAGLPGAHRPGRHGLPRLPPLGRPRAHRQPTHN